MKLTLFELVSSEQSIVKLMSNDLPIKKSYRLSLALKKIAEYMEVYREQRKKLLDKYGKPSEENNENYTIERENVDIFNNELNELHKEEVELEIEPISVDELDENIKLSPIDMVNLEKFLKI